MCRIGPRAELCIKFSRTGFINPAGPIPEAIYPLIARVCGIQEQVAEGVFERDLNKIFYAFANDPLVTCGIEDAKKLFKEMCENTKEYLTMYDLTKL